MSYFDCPAPVCASSPTDIDLVIKAPKKDLGGFSVRRFLPAPSRRSIGPFVFFDHMGPAEFPPGNGIDVRPHPHIAIATITYLFDGLIMHRDSLGYEQQIAPGEVNLMVAGKGIAHSERAGDDLNKKSKLNGIQTWIALPEEMEDINPLFQNYPRSSIPLTEPSDGVIASVIIGEAFGEKSPVKTFSSTLYVDLSIEENQIIELPNNVSERALYIVEGQVTVNDQLVHENSMVSLSENAKMTLKAELHTRVIMIGGEAIGARKMWWNFVSKSQSKIEVAKRSWADGNFGSVINDSDFIPLPDK